MKPRKTKKISEIIEELGKREIFSEASLLLKLKENWPEIVGGIYARHSRPAGLKKGELRIAFDNSVWKSEFHISRPEIIEKINGFAGFIVIREIVLV